MRETIALVVGIGLGVVAIGLNVNGYINKTILGLLLIIAIAGGLAIANYDRIIRFKGGGIDIEMARNEIDKAKNIAIEKINEVVSNHEESIRLLTRDANQARKQLENTISQVDVHKKAINELTEVAKQLYKQLLEAVKMATPPTLSLLDTNVEKTDSGHKAILRFKPSKNQPLGQIILIAKVKEGKNAKITNFWPHIGLPFLTGPDSKKTSDDGKEARLIFGVLGVGCPEVELHISDSAKVEISGNLLTEPVLLEIK